MKVPKSVSLDTHVIQQIKAAAKGKRESVSKWVEDAVIERMERETPLALVEQPLKIPLATKKAAQLVADHAERRMDRSKRGKTSRGDRRSNEE